MLEKSFGGCRPLLIWFGRVHRHCVLAVEKAGREHSDDTSSSLAPQPSGSRPVAQSFSLPVLDVITANPFKRIPVIYLFHYTHFITQLVLHLRLFATFTHSYD